MIRNQRGQTSIFLALFIATMVMLFAFTTNIGMLVHAKINLQNAADAAAYAGAAVQARQLTTVSYLNYEMRRALRQYLYLYMVRGSKDQSCFPRDSTGSPLGACGNLSFPADGRYPFFIADPRYTSNEVGGPFIPTTCVAFTPQINNYCAAKDVPGIPTFKGAGFFGIVDPVVQSIITRQNEIIGYKIDDCRDRTASNEIIFFSWLFNTNPLATPARLIPANHNKEFLDPFDKMTGIDTLGYLIRYAMLRARIDNLEESLNLNLANEGMPVTITSASIDIINGAKTANKTLDYFERPLQAYLSAVNNLPDINVNNGIFTNVKLTELLPNQIANVTRNPNLKNPPVLAKFNDINTPVVVANSRFDVTSVEGQCTQGREKRSFESFPFGVTKDPNVLTYYAVRLEAKVRLLFSPMPGDGMVTISAYSAAKPFGSRIGKDLTQKPEDYMTAMAKSDAADLVGDEVPIPNILVGNDDTSSNSDGFSRAAHLGYLFSAMLAPQIGIDGAFTLAGAYTPWEVGYYTPPANFSQPEDMGAFADNPIYDPTTGVYTLNAPIIPVNGADNSLSFLRTKVQEYLNGSLVGQASINAGSSFYQFYMKTVLGDDAFTALFDYLAEKKLVNFHPILDPLLNNRPEIVSWAKANGGARFTVAAMPNGQKRQLTSWNNYKNAVGSGLNSPNEMDLHTGRAGYSVRFVSFPSLTAGGRSSNDPAVTTNFPNPFSLLDAVNDIPRLKDDISKLKH